MSKSIEGVYGLWDCQYNGLIRWIGLIISVVTLVNCGTQQKITQFIGSLVQVQPVYITQESLICKLIFAATIKKDCSKAHSSGSASFPSFDGRSKQWLSSVTEDLSGGLCTYPLALDNPKFVWLKPISNTQTEINGLVNSLPCILSVKGHCTLPCSRGIIGKYLFCWGQNSPIFQKVHSIVELV